MFKVLYNEETRFILDLVVNIEHESYNLDNYKDKKKAIPIQTRNGSFNLPMVEYNDGENEIVLWAENVKDWKESIDDLINTINNI